MVRDRTARSRIRRYLAEVGPLEEGSGHATGALKDAIGYEGSSVAFIQLIASMDRDGEIDREIRGKRTYRISAAGDSSAASDVYAAPGRPARVVAATTGGSTAVVEIDYTQLAKALVGELLGFVAGTAAPAPATTAVGADRATLEAERNEYARRLEVAREKLDELLSGEIEMSPPAAVATTV